MRSCLVETDSRRSWCVPRSTDFYGTVNSDNGTIPNYMLGDGDQFQTVLCGKGMMSVQATTATGAALSVVGLLGSIVAVFNPSAGYSERVVSFCTLVSCTLSLLVALFPRESAMSLGY